ncbi:MAG: hypothetical protein D6791_00880 [Chloroflexi bacterium]|nr:MAG: hypothetical protein D6791_00880 [Chloroflexota bacterium]
MDELLAALVKLPLHFAVSALAPAPLTDIRAMSRKRHALRLPLWAVVMLALLSGFALSCTPAPAPSTPEITAIPIDLAPPTGGAAPATPPDPLTEATPVAATPVTATASDLEDRWGIRMTFVGVTAGGGLVDVRFKVIDPSKAQPILGDPKNLPVLVSEDGVTIAGPSILTDARTKLRPGQMYFLLYSNPRGAIKSGSPVSVIVGGLRLDNVIAR